MLPRSDDGAARQHGADNAALFSALLSHAFDAVCVLDADGRIRWTNEPAGELTGRPVGELIGASAFDLVHPDDMSGVRRAFAAGMAAASDTGREHSFRIRGPEPSWKRVSARANSRVDDPVVQGMIVTVREETFLDETVRALRRAEHRYRAVVDAVGEGVLVCSPEGSVEACNPAAERLLGRSRHEIIGRAAAEIGLIGEDGAPLSPGEFPTDTLRTGAGYHNVVVAAPSPAGMRWLSLSTRSIVVEDQERPSAVVVSFADVTELRRAEAALRTSEQRFRSLVSAASDAVLICAADGRVRHAGPPALRLLGLHADEIAAVNLADLVSGEDLAAVDAAFRSVVEGESAVAPVEFARSSTGGAEQYLEAGFTNLLDDLAVDGIIVSLRDVTERRLATDALTHRALHDQLTGLPNRALFLDRLSHALDRNQRQRNQIAVLFADVDHFKQVNDNLGHEAGDRVLVALATRVRHALRPGDTVGRFAGDEFVVLCEGVTEEEAQHIADRLAGVASAPVAVGPGHELHVTMSVGIALTDDPTTTPGALIANADAAMYRAKQMGRARSQVFSPSMKGWAGGRTATGSGPI